MTKPPTPSPGPREMRLRYAGRCRGCATELPRSTRAVYDPASKTVRCLVCENGHTGTEVAGEAVTTHSGPGEVKLDVAADPHPAVTQCEVRVNSAEDEAKAPPVQNTTSGIAGSSARREHERRVAAREERIRERHPRLGGLILALSDDPQTTTAWATGAEGEERLGRRLDSLAGPLVRVLHDRRIPGSRANLDHLAVCPSGVFVVDAKRYKGRPQRSVEAGLFSPRTEKLLVGRRDCTQLVDAGLKQAELVQEALGDGSVEVRSVLCFVEADWPLLGGDFTIRDVTCTWPRKLGSTITRPGPLTEAQIASVYQGLAAAFPPA